MGASPIPRPISDSHPYWGFPPLASSITLPTEIVWFAAFNNVADSSSVSSDTEREGPSDSPRGVRGDAGSHLAPGTAGQPAGPDAELARQFKQTFISYHGGSVEAKMREEPTRTEQLKQQPSRNTLNSPPLDAPNPEAVKPPAEPCVSPKDLVFKPADGKGDTGVGKGGGVGKGKERL